MSFTSVIKKLPKMSSTAVIKNSPKCINNYLMGGYSPPYVYLGGIRSDVP
jgi:hypothetical protein